MQPIIHKVNLNDDEPIYKVSPHELIWLTRIINSEAHGESFFDKLLVGSVLINRLNDVNRPNGIYEVIYEKNQFAGINSKYFRHSMETPSDIESYKAALFLLNHGVINNSIQYFLNPKTSANKQWIKKLRESKKAEVRTKNHIFYS